MESYLPENEYKEFEGRAYVEPQVSLNETNTFIDNLRAAQGKQNEQIKTDTQMLGTNVPSDLGGLTGANSYFSSRYQTPQTNAAVNNLRASAQASALNELLQNEQAMWKKRYQDAYRKYQKAAYDRSRSSGGSGGNGGGSGDNSSTWGGEIDLLDTTSQKQDGQDGVDKKESDGGSTVTPPNVTDYLQDEDEIYKNVPEGWKWLFKKINGDTANA